MKATIYLHASKESNIDLGESLGLKGKALEMFAYACYEVKVEMEVDPDGNARIIAVNDRPLT